MLWRRLWRRSTSLMPHNKPRPASGHFLNLASLANARQGELGHANRQDDCPQGETSRPHEGVYLLSATTPISIGKSPANACQARCNLFATVYNPDGQRLGNKVLRQRLRGPALASYYPRRRVTVKDMGKVFGPEMETWDEDEQDRLEHLEEYVDADDFVLG